MTIVLISITIGLALIIGHISLISILIRSNRKIAPVAIHAFSGLSILTILVLIYVWGWVFDFFLTFSLVSFGISTYLFLFGACYKSLSLQFLLAIKSSGGMLSWDDLDKKITHPSFNTRSELLCTMNLVERKDESYHITPKGRRMIERIMLIRKLFSISTTGFY